jgi:DNA mismatch repair protein MutL
MRDETNQPLTGTEPARTVDPATGEVSFIADGMDLLRYIGKMRDRYILAEGPDGLYLIDGCAAWERILYERLLQYYDEKRDQTAERAATFDIANIEGFDEWLPVFKRLDIHMETFGPTTIRVRRTPDILTIEDVQLVMTQVMQELPGASRLLTVEEKMEWLLARIVYWAGSRYGTDENMPSPADLLSQLQVCRSPRITPSGKATMIHLSLDLLTRQFDH